MRLVTLLLTLVCTLHAQDLTGRWTGTADTIDEAGVKRQEKLNVEIRSEDGKLIGTQIKADGTPGVAVKVVQDGPKVNLYRYLTLDDGEHLRWKLELKDGKLVGTYLVHHDNPKKWIYDRTGPVTAARTATTPAK